MSESLENRRWRLLFRVLWLMLVLSKKTRPEPNTRLGRYLAELEEEIERDV
jgi:hypothetical protein